MNERIDCFDFRRPQQNRQPGGPGGQGNAAGGGGAGGQRGPKREAAQPAVIPVSKSKFLNISFD